MANRYGNSKSAEKETPLQEKRRKVWQKKYDNVSEKGNEMRSIYNILGDKARLDTISESTTVKNLEDYYSSDIEKQIAKNNSDNLPKNDFKTRQQSPSDKLINKNKSVDEDNVEELPTTYNYYKYILGGIGSLLAGTTVSGAVYNTKAMNNAYKAIIEASKVPSNIVGFENADAFVQAKLNELKLGNTGFKRGMAGTLDALYNNTILNKTKVTPSFTDGGVVTPKKQWTVGTNVVKTASTLYPKNLVNKVRNWYNPIEPVVPEKPIANKKVYMLPEKTQTTNPLTNDKGQRLLKSPNPTATDFEVSSSGQVKNQKLFIADSKGNIEIPKKYSTGKSGTLSMNLNPNDPSVKRAVKLFKKVGGGLLKNSAAIGTALAYMANEQESVDKYGVGAKAVADNVVNTTIDIANPLNYLRLANMPTQIVSKILKDTYVGDVAGAIGGTVDKGINAVEDEVKKNFNKKMQEEKDLRQMEEDKKARIKAKSTPSFTGSDMLNAVIYGDTKKSGSDALSLIADTYGIPKEKLLSEGRKMWLKQKK